MKSYNEIMYGVYTQFYPKFEYPETLESLWIDKEEAIAAAKRGSQMCDYIWVAPISINKESLYETDEDFVIIKTL